jgi:hypothetical protein
MNLNDSKNINKIANALSKYSNEYIYFVDLFKIIQNLLKTNEVETQNVIKLLEENDIISLTSYDDLYFKIKSIQEIRKLKIERIFKE